MKRSKLYKDILKNNSKIEQENREKLRTLYEKYCNITGGESEVIEDAKTEKK